MPPSHPSQNAFETLGLPQKFHLETSELRRAWLARSAQLHPDRVGPGVDSAREMARLNIARDTLADAEKRANLLLELAGGPAKEQDKSLPEGFLLETLELRERVEEALGSGNHDIRGEIERDARLQREEFIRRVDSMFSELGEPPSESSLAAIRTQLNAWRYVERLIEQLDPAYDPNHADFSG